MNKILVLGAFGFHTTLYDGQTIKTRNLLDLLKSKGVGSDFYDTQDFQYNKLGIVKMFAKVCKADCLFYLPAQNNLKYIFPIVFFLSKIFHTRIHYFVVGGWLKEYLEDKPRIKKKLSKIDGIHCETKLMKRLLEDNYQFKNVDVFPNFRINNFVPTTHHQDGLLKMVFEARVIKQKGLDTIFSMGERIMADGLEKYISLDFYGPIQDVDGDEVYFKEGLTKYPFMKYHGPLEPDQINSTLEKYDVMVLPTHFYTEGLPGSVLDAYISGIPVIVTKWKHATEFVDDEKTGYIIPFEDNGDALFDKVVFLLNNPEVLFEMKTAARSRWYDFSAEKAWELIQSYIK